MSRSRVQRYAEAMAEADGGADLGCFPGDYEPQAQAALVVADMEQAELTARVERRHKIERWQRARAQVAEAKVARVEALLDRLEDEPRAVCFSGAAFDPILTTGDVRAALEGEKVGDADKSTAEPQEERCMVEGCDKPDAHAFLTITEDGLAHLRVRDGF